MQEMTIPAVSLVLALALGTAAAAQDLTEAHLGMLDQNSDGSVSMDEYRDYTEAAFDALDMDGDGMVSGDEFARVLPPDRMPEVDADGDGQISPDEYSDRTLADFETADADANAALN